jgi:hypothetical protein
LFILLCAIACLAGSLVLVLAPPTKNPPLAVAVGVAIGWLSLWIASVAVRLIFNMSTYGGLLSPLVIRLVAIYCAAFPTFLLITGKSSTWSAWQYLQAAAYIFGAFGLWRLAAWRKASHLRA